MSVIDEIKERLVRYSDAKTAGILFVPIDVYLEDVTALYLRLTQDDVIGTPDES